MATELNTAANETPSAALPDCALNSDIQHSAFSDASFANPDEAVPEGDIDDAAPVECEAVSLSNGAPHFAFDQGSWRTEVAARLEHFRSRRKPRAPRYPSLLLPFDAPQVAGQSGLVASASMGATALAPEPFFPDMAAAAPAAAGIDALLLLGPAGLCDAEGGRLAAAPAGNPPHPLAKVIEFPRWAAVPATQPDQLAEPLIDRPRIVEAPAIQPPPPVLGGILLESMQPRPQREAERDLPASASVARRALAGLLDGLVLAGALAAFAAIFVRLNPAFKPRREDLSTLALALGGIVPAFWLAYQFLFVVCTGSTPGLLAARLRLVRFDGSPLRKAARRWRVLASALSAGSLALGYLWCLLDEDGLCWHDRITRSHLRRAEPAGHP